MSFWIPLYMGQQFKLDTAQAGILSGAVIVVGGGIGTVVGGYLADLIQSRGQPSARLLVPGFGYALSAPFILIAVTTAALPAFLAAMFGATALLQFSSGPLTALSQDVIIPARRARAVALSLLLTHLLGDAFAPFALGGLSDTLGSLQRAFLVTPASVLVAAAIAFVGCRWVAADRAAMLREAGSTSS